MPSRRWIFYLLNDKVGMILENNNNVISIMKMACLDNIYVLNNVKCTGDHKVKYNNEWIKVKNLLLLIIRL
jgi:hypothetical protein